MHSTEVGECWERWLWVLPIEQSTWTIAVALDGRRVFSQISAAWSKIWRLHFHYHLSLSILLPTNSLLRHVGQFCFCVFKADPPWKRQNSKQWCMCLLDGRRSRSRLKLVSYSGLPLNSATTDGWLLVCLFGRDITVLVDWVVKHQLTYPLGDSVFSITHCQDQTPTQLLNVDWSMRDKKTKTKQKIPVARMSVYPSAVRLPRRCQKNAQFQRERSRSGSHVARCTCTEPPAPCCELFMGCTCFLSVV